MATYRGVPYEAGEGPSGADVVLFAACPPPEELGFEPATGHWRKRVVRAEVDALWESRPVGSFHGEPCLVLDDLGDRLHIAYLGLNPGKAALLGYWQVDRGVFELLTPREEVTGLTEERIERPLRPAAVPLAAPAGPDSGPAHPYRAGSPLTVPAARGGPSAGAATTDDTLVTGPAFPAGTPPAGPAGPADVPAPGPPPAPLPPPAPQAPGTGPAPPADAGAADTPIGHSLAQEMPGARWPAREAAPETGGRAARRQRVTSRDVFCELADLAAIPRAAYMLEAEVDGAMCLLPTPSGYEVFVAADGARHEVRSFADEEAAYFYLFGVLAAEAIRNGGLAPTGRPEAVSPRQHELPACLVKFARIPRSGS